MKSDNTLLDVVERSTGAAIDSRTILPGQLFFALPGTKTDGSLFAAEALENGAIAAVVSLDCDVDTSGDAYWPVEDVLKTMQQLAREYRRLLDVPVMAITGSNGKTTNKNLLAAALQMRYCVHFTDGNYNNHIGLPLTILNAPRDTEFLLLEMGTNHFGEIKNLCRIAEPDHGSILNVGKTHLEFLHSVRGVLKAKSELAVYLKDHDGHLFLNLEEESLDPLEVHPVNMSFFDRNHLPGTDYRIHVEKNSGGIVLRLQSETASTLTLKSLLWGGHNVKNLIHAIAVSSYFEVEMEEVVEALSSYEPRNNRSQILEWKGHRVYLDAYNANPTSMSQSIIFFRKEHAGAGAVILGDMGELGDTAIKEHKMILELVNDMGFQQVWLVGKLFKEAAAGDYPQFEFCTDVRSVREDKIADGVPILVKGSRSMALERLVGG